MQVSTHIMITEKKASYFFTQKLPKQAKVKQNKDLVLETMLSDVNPAVKWFKNGKPIEVSKLFNGNVYS